MVIRPMNVTLVHSLFNWLICPFLKRLGWLNSGSCYCTYRLLRFSLCQLTWTFLLTGKLEGRVALMFKQGQRSLMLDNCMPFLILPVVSKLIRKKLFMTKCMNISTGITFLETSNWFQTLSFHHYYRNK